MQLLKEQTITKSKKKHKCFECLGIINIGDSYYKQSIADMGTIYDYRTHPRCREISVILNADEPDWEWTPLHEYDWRDVENVRKQLEQPQQREKSE